MLFHRKCDLNGITQGIYTYTSHICSRYNNYIHCTAGNIGDWRMCFKLSKLKPVKLGCDCIEHMDASQSKKSRKTICKLIGKQNSRRLYGIMVWHYNYHMQDYFIEQTYYYHLHVRLDVCSKRMEYVSL